MTTPSRVDHTQSKVRFWELPFQTLRHKLLCRPLNVLSVHTTRMHLQTSRFGSRSQRLYWRTVVLTHNKKRVWFLRLVLFLKRHRLTILRDPLISTDPTRQKKTKWVYPSKSLTINRILVWQNLVFPWSPTPSNLSRTSGSPLSITPVSGPSGMLWNERGEKF